MSVDGLPAFSDMIDASMTATVLPRWRSNVISDLDWNAFLHDSAKRKWN